MTVGSGTVDRFKSDPHVTYIEPNYIASASAGPNDPRRRDVGLNNMGQNGGASTRISMAGGVAVGTGGTGSWVTSTPAWIWITSIWQPTSTQRRDSRQ